MRYKLLLAAAGAAIGLAGSRAGRRSDDISGEVAVITGASRGLGLLLAHELARYSCPLVICARDGAELDRAAAGLRCAGAEVSTIVCDITAPGAPQLLVDTAIEHYGRLDIVISNAGLIQVGPAENTAAADYETAWRTMAFAPVRIALAALPSMRQQEHGRIVTITSIGGKVSVPHLLPYSAAKFAAVAFSEGLRAELGAGPVKITTVVPGLMRTGSHVQARFTGRRDQEFTWFALGASLPLVSMDAERAAHQIVAAVRARRAEVILTPLGQAAARTAGIAPELTSAALHLGQKLLLPAATSRNGQPVAGKDLRPAPDTQLFAWLTTLGRAAARRFNQLPGRPGPGGSGPG
jgi:short-subunit dehydrogenase